MEDKLISPMQDFLPGALSKWILGVSIAISGSLLMFPSYDLPAKYLTDTDIIKLLTRLLSAGMPLLIGLMALIVLQVRHNRKTTRELTEEKSENKAYFHQVSSLNTDKNTLQTLLDETKLNLENLTSKHVPLRQSHSVLTEQNKELLSKIDLLSSAADSFRDEARQMRTHATEIQKELTSLKAEYNDLKQRNAGTESLAIMRGRLLDQCQQELEEIKKSPPPPSANAWT